MSSGSIEEEANVKANAEFMTVYLNTRFLRAVQLPCTFLASARLDRLEGRKAFVGVWIEDEGAVKLASAEVLFALPKEKLQSMVFDEMDHQANREEGKSHIANVQGQGSFIRCLYRVSTAQIQYEACVLLQDKNLQVAFFSLGVSCRIDICFE